MNHETERLGISDILRKVQIELIESEKDRRRSAVPALFETDSCEVEIKFVVKESTSSGGKLDLKLVALNLGENASIEVVHSVRIKFSVLKETESEDWLGDIEKPRGLRPRDS